MVWEFIATISAGLGLAGIALILRMVFKQLPKSIIPASAGIGMLLFQIYSEYTWYNHTKSLLPHNTTVVAAIPEPAFYKPWSYIKAPILKFVAVEKGQAKPISDHSQILQTTLYFFERRMSAKNWPIIINCQTRLQAPIEAVSIQNNQTNIPADKWYRTPYTDNIIAAECTQ